MTGKERISRILKHQPVDRIGLYEHFWGDTHADYVGLGHLQKGERFEDHFGLEIIESWASNTVIDMDFTPVTVSEDKDTRTLKDGNGALLRRHKFHDTTPEHVDFTIREREDWEAVKPKLLSETERRINFDGYRKAKTYAAKAGKFFVWSGVNVFEMLHPVCGHEHLLVGMALDPEWITDMAETYAGLALKLQDILFEREGLPDGIWYYEDMGFKERPFISPQMYMDLIFPSHKKTIAFAHERNLPVIMHSCGFVEPLLPGMIEAGIDCLQVIEIKAGMDLLRIHKQYGDKIALMGGIDVRKLYTNDFNVIDEELESKIPIVKEGYGYVTHSDHSIPKTVAYETLQYYIKRALELGAY
jgi:uroporphyrinogen decarboxylase